MVVPDVPGPLLHQGPLRTFQGDERNRFPRRALNYPTPTLILQGDIDKSVPLEKSGRPTHELMPGSRLLVYENAAHGLPYTHTDRMLADIIAFAGA
jgi:non-heme chloroperoxidase